jgi:hypothetical protein
MAIIATERTRDVYEEIDGYAKPPLAPVPEPDDLSYFEHLGFRLGRPERRVIRAGMWASGFRSFQKRLQQNSEDLLRRTNIRGPVLFAPILSATVALEDDPRDLPPHTRAATLLLAAFRLRRDILSAKLPPDRYGDQDLEMGLYPNFFATNVIVDKKGSRLFKSTNDSYVVVVAAGRFYKLNISNLDSEADAYHLEHALARIANDARARRRRSDDPSPGILTCAGHRTQLRAFRKLRRDPVNVDSLETMKHNLFTLCMDLDDFPTSHAESTRLAHSLNGSNRWHHSSMQLVVFGNGKACAICNFNAYLDGNTMMRGAAEIQRRAVECTSTTESGGGVRGTEPIEIQWRVSGQLASRAGKELRSVQDGQQATFAIEGTGRSFFISRGIDPVAAFTLALVVATKRLTGSVVRVEQFLTMSRYRCMGLAMPNVTTPEVVTFVEYVVSDEFDRTRAAGLLRDAVDSQIERCRSARRTLPLGQLMSLFVHSSSGPRKAYAIAVTVATRLFLQLLRAIPGGSEVILSHPSIHPEVPILGRPGIRLPYVQYFALHYQMLEESVDVTVMPGVGWSVQNAELVAVLQDGLRLVGSIVSDNE